jgi:glutamate/tyrosine decarboxylase-like PLP-dependent enzyme
VSGLLHDAAARAQKYLDTLAGRRVSPSPEALAALQRLDTPLQDDPIPAERVLAELDDLGTPATVASAGGRFFGFVVGGTLPAAVAANVLATAWDQNAGLDVLSPAAAAIEDVARRWLLSVLQLPASAGAAFVTGATMANFTALAAARHSVLDAAGWNVEEQGLFGAPPMTVIVGEEVHVGLLRSLSMLGLGRSRVVRVPVDDQGRMRADRVPEITGPTILCLQAGNVNTGAFDPAPEIIPRAHDAGAWVHVDGAFGLWAAGAPARASLMRGYDRADSWALDAHKWLNVPYDSGVAFVHDPDDLLAAMSISAAYLVHGDRREPSQYTPEMSRRARGVEVWAALRSLGRDGVADLVERSCRHATRFAEGLGGAGFEVLNDVVLNQVLVSFGTPDETRRVIRGIQEDGTCWCGGTEWQGRTAMRISVSSWATTTEDVEKSLAAMIRVARG